MSNRGRLGVILGAVAILIVAFVVLNPSDSSKKSDDPASAAKTTGEDTSPTATARDALPAPPEQLVMKNGSIQGGVRSIKAKKNDRVRITVTSDRADEIHLHGYNIEKEVAPGKPVKFDFKANIEGIFEIESHKNEDAGKPPLIARLVVNPS